MIKIMCCKDSLNKVNSANGLTHNGYNNKENFFIVVISRNFTLRGILFRSRTPGAFPEMTPVKIVISLSKIYQRIRLSLKYVIVYSYILLKYKFEMKAKFIGLCIGSTVKRVSISKVSPKIKYKTK